MGVWRPDSKLQSCLCFTNCVQMQCMLVPLAHSGQVASKVVDSVGEDQYCSGISSTSVDFEAKFQAMGSGSISDKCENGSPSQIKYIHQRCDCACSDFCCATVRVRIFAVRHKSSHWIDGQSIAGHFSQFSDFTSWENSVVRGDWLLIHGRYSNWVDHSFASVWVLN